MAFSMVHKNECFSLHDVNVRDDYATIDLIQSAVRGDGDG